MFWLLGPDIPKRVKRRGTHESPCKTTDQQDSGNGTKSRELKHVRAFFLFWWQCSGLFYHDSRVLL